MAGLALIITGCVIQGVYSNYLVFLGLILVIELGAGIASYTFRDKVGAIIEDNMEKGLQNYGVDGYDGVTKTWNIVQHQLKCCGAQEYMDWDNTTFSETNNSVPDSCCLSDIEGCGAGILAMPADQVPKIIYVTGCIDKLNSVIVGNVAMLGGAGVGIALIQFAGIIFSCVLAASIRKGYEQV